MKHISIFFLFFLYSFSIHAQDTIKLKNGVIINASILERSRTSIKYTLNNQTSEDTIGCAKLSKVSTIHYENGKVDLLSSQNPRSIFPLGINVGIGCLFPILNGNIDYLFIPNISAEINYRSTLNSYPYIYIFSIGGKYWFANKYSKNGFSPFVGLFFSHWKLKNDDERILDLHERVWFFRNVPEIPIGIIYISKSGFQTSLQLNCFLGYKNLDNELQRFKGFIEIRVGWRFKTGKKGY